MPADTQDEPDLDLELLLRRSLRHKRLTVAVAVLVLAATSAFAVLQKNVYSSSTKLILQTSGSSLGGSLGALASLAGMDASSKSSDPSLYIEDILRSTDLAQAVLDRPWKGGKAEADTSKAFLLRDFWGTKSDTTVSDWVAKEREGLIQRLNNGKYIAVARNKKSGVITLSTQFEDPRLSYDINRFLVETVNDILVNRLSGKAGENRKFIESRAKEVKESLTRDEIALRNFRANNRVRTDPEYQLEEGRLQRSLQIDQEIYLQLVKQYEMAKIDEAKDIPVLDVIDSPRLPMTKSGPNRKLIVLAGGMGGLILGLFASLLFDLYAENKKRFWTRFAGGSPFQPSQG
jgi:uncharacterized protein involved in exopolysaccharide biosynthesis